MARMNDNKLADLQLLALGLYNLCGALRDPANQGSIVARDYLADGMTKKLAEFSRNWDIIKTC